MVGSARIMVLMLLGTLGVLLCGCSASAVREDGELPEQRPSDFTFGLVVFGDEHDGHPETRSARYIIEPGGALRASFGDGSTGLTYPPITRILDQSQLDRLWSMLGSMGLDDQPWRTVRAPELHHETLGSERGYLLELRNEVRFSAWSTPIETPEARALAQWLAELAWNGD